MSLPFPSIDSCCGIYKKLSVHVLNTWLTSLIGIEQGDDEGHYLNNEARVTTVYAGSWI